ncbi:MAG TPA: pseudouridine synthase [Thermoanaerobaculia bacterium]|nr:pseudouridine synthase [Thermoanaerobaculia bacterium]HUM29490.1 pseudouridine synthase [Thermoanaerobaculia bacterium]HXK67873.1 pseudouridine synthase [Thermoanaerobaculia bacterium]
MKILTFSVDVHQAGLRLDQFLASVDPALSRREWRQVITLGGVHRDRKRMSRVASPVSEGETYTVYMDGGELKPKYSIHPGDLLLDDGDLLAVNKPPGVEAQPTHARYKGTVYAAVRDYLKSQGFYATIGMHSRLDREVSGVMVLSVSRRAHPGMTQIFQERKVLKVYLGVVRNGPESETGRIDLSLKRHGGGSVAVTEGGKEACTDFRVMERKDHVALVAFFPRTGRTHQVRVHAGECGMPLIGDALYGEISPLIDRPALHAYSYVFRHPVTDAEVEITAPLPPDFLNLLRDTRLSLPGPVPGPPEFPSDPT